MFLRSRPVHPDDLELCFQLIRNRFAFSTCTDRADLIALWRELLCDGTMIGAVIEDGDAPSEDKKIAWLCFKVFATDAFADFLKSEEAAPLPARQLLDLRRRGEKLPVLSSAEIRKVNSSSQGGLNMLVTHFGSPYPLREDCPQWNEVASNLLDFTDYFSSGYRAHELLEEFYDDYNVTLALNAGFCPRNDFSTHYRTHPLPPVNERPFLLGVTFAEAKQKQGTIGAVVFHYQPPHFYFKSTEQELLVHALLGETDEEIATHLNLANVSVRKRWAAIYDRVTDAVPGFFKTVPEHTMQQNSLHTRGPEKKRYLLSYLRRHLSELRPIEPSTSASVD